MRHYKGTHDQLVLNLDRFFLSISQTYVKKGFRIPRLNKVGEDNESYLSTDGFLVLFSS